MPNNVTKQICVCQICICGEHKCDRENPKGTVRQVCKQHSRGECQFVTSSSHAENVSNQEQLRRKQWQKSEEDLKNILESYPKIETYRSSSSVEKRDQKGKNQKKKVNRLPPLGKSKVNTEFSPKSENGLSKERDGDRRKGLNRQAEVALSKKVRPETSLSYSHPIDHLYSLGHYSKLDKSLREDLSMSCEPEWIVTKPEKVKPRDNIRLEGEMDLETTFRSTIDSAAQQLLSRQEKVTLSMANEIDQSSASQSQHGKPPKTSTLRRPVTRPKTSLKPGGQGYFTTLNKDTYKNFVIVDTSREKMVQERFEKIIQSTANDQTSFGSYKEALKIADEVDETDHSSYSSSSSLDNLEVGERKNMKTDQTQTMTKSIKESNVVDEMIEKVDRSRIDRRVEGDSSMTNGMAKSNSRNDAKLGKRRTSGDAILKERQKGCLKTEKVEPTNYSMRKHEKSFKVKNQSRHSEVSNEIDDDLKPKLEKPSVSKSEATKTTKTKTEKREQAIENAQSGEEESKPLSTRPSPFRPVSSLTVSGKFKSECEESMTAASKETSHRQRRHYQASEARDLATEERIARQKLAKSNLSKSTFNLEKASSKQTADRLSSVADRRRHKSLPRTRINRNKNESQLKFDGEMDFQTTTKQFYQDGNWNQSNYEASRNYLQKPKRDLFRTSSEAEFFVKPAFDESTTYNSQYRNKLYCPAIDLNSRISDYQYKGEAGGHHFYLPMPRF